MTTIKSRILFPPDSVGNIALQFSGGKDSLALAHLLRPHWDRLTFYHVDTGDLLPEVREIVDGIEALVPRFVRIETHAADWHERFGLPSDLVPTTCTPAGNAIGIGSRRLVDRFDCCASNIMAPMHARMVADGVALVIRGTKRADMPRLPAENGPTGMGYDLWLPLLEWSDADVFAYLREVGAPICRVYENGVQSPECATCPAWWSEGRAAYLAKHHPDLSASYHAKLATVAAEISPLWAHLQREIAG
jgi:3'-phosphoadenosine 5'-phosphosulfate sulfotransferase (PAPS reductase)/FAD synthetase